MEYAENTASDLNSIDTRADDLRKVLRNNNTTLLSIIKKGDKNVDNVLLGRITAGDYIEQKKAEIAAQEKLKAEAEAKRIAEEKAERERLAKERLASEEEEKRKKEAGNTPPPKVPDEDRSEPIMDEDDRPGRDRNERDEKPIKRPPKNDDGEKTPPPPRNDNGGRTPPPSKDADDERPPSPPRRGGGGGGGGEKGPARPIDVGIFSITIENGYYLDTLAGKENSITNQASPSITSLYTSNELSALQPITSLNVAGLPVNDTAIKDLTAITHIC